jgi:hypothetical protein
MMKAVVFVEFDVADLPPKFDSVIREIMIALENELPPESQPRIYLAMENAAQSLIDHFHERTKGLT